ncbi:MAG TPA: amidohydrolase, partial [Anaerolineae bacterium]
TAGIVAQKLRDAGYEVTEKVGRTGVVGLLKNGEGPTVMVRADMDALPMAEETGLPYASTAQGTNKKGEMVPVAHSCGHDIHTSWLIGATTVLAQARAGWHGTLMAVFQPAEETAEGSQAMLDDGMLHRFPRPDVSLAQHLLQYRAGDVRYRAGQVLTAGDSLLVRFFGKGAHGAMPQIGIDPIVMTASAVLRLQTIVSREVAPDAQVVVTVGEFHAGTAENIIAAEAYIKLNVRTTDEAVRDHVLEAIRRICTAEARASNAPKDPEFEVIDSYPLTVNDPEVTRKVAEAFRDQFGNRASEATPAGASEDFSRFGRAWKTPYMMWFVGGTAPEKYDQAVAAGTVGKLPGPHSPLWAPALHPTLETGIETILTAAGVWLADGN